MKPKNLLNSTLSLLALSLTIGTTAAIAATPYVDSVKGRVELKRKNVSNEGFRGITRGPVSLSSGDQLKISRGAIARIACPGQKTIVEKLGTGDRLTPQQICPTWRPPGIDKGAPPRGEMGGKDAQIPYLISPRRSLILTPTPTLRWNPVAGATQYTVQIKNAQGIVWQTQVKTPQVTYPGTTALIPGIPYTVIVKTNTGKSSESELGSQFFLLRSAELQTVQAETNLITQIDASPEIKALRLAEYYANYKLPETAYGLTEKTVKDYSLSADAIDTLETLLKTSKPTPLIYRKLGTLYTNIGVTLPAEEAYLKAIDSIQSPEDLEEWTLTAVVLGELYDELSQNPKQAIGWYTKQAIGWYQQARAGFIFLSDKSAETVTNRIEKLKNI
jgi:hypothetical protein